jgi:hypothetical protein
MKTIKPDRLRLKNTSSNAKSQKKPAFLLHVFERTWRLHISGAVAFALSAIASDVRLKCYSHLTLIQSQKILFDAHFQIYEKSTG